jgi:hypothetical protein
MSGDIEELKEEIRSLKKDMVRVLRLLDQLPSEDDPLPKFPSLEAAVLAVRSDDYAIPLIARATEDGVEIGLYDSNHQTRALFSLGASGACLEFRNSSGKLVAELSEAADGSGQFCICDAEGIPRAAMRHSPLGGVVSVLNEQSKPQAMLIGSEHGGEIIAANNQQRPAVKLFCTSSGGTVSVHENSGQVMGFLAADHLSGACTVYGPLGSPAASLAASDEGGAAVFYDAEGVSKAILP